MATKGKKVEFYYTSQGTSTGIDASALLFDGKNLTINTHGKTFKGTDTWNALSNATDGYVPKAADGVDSTDASTYYFLGYSGTTVNWFKLPENAFNDSTYTVNNATYSIRAKVEDDVSILSTFTSNQDTDSSFTIIQGTNVTLTSDVTNKTLTISSKDTNTWTAASTSEAGYIPKLVTGGSNIASSSLEYVLSYKSGTDLTPTWKLLPVNAFKNDNDNTWQAANATQEGYVPKTTASKILRTDANGIVYWGDDSDTHYATSIAVGTSGTTGNNTATDPYIKIFDDSTYKSQIQLKAGTGISIGSDTNGVVTIASTGSSSDVKTKQTDNNENADRPILLKYGTGTGEVTNGTLFADGVTVNPSTNSLSVSGNLSVTGTASFSNNVTFSNGVSVGSDSRPSIILNGSIGQGSGRYIVFDTNSMYLAANKSGDKIYLESIYSDAPYFRGSGGDYKIIHEGNISSQSVNYATSAGSVAWGNVTGKPSTFTPSSHSHDYLPLNGGTMTGIISRDAGGSWISAREHVIIKTTRTSGEGGDWHPAVGIKTSAGFWSFGSVGGEHLGFSYDTDANYNAGSNTSTVINIPRKAGTIALTSDIPSSLPANGGNADTVDSQHFTYSNTDNNPTYLWGTNSNGSSILAHRASMSVNYANSAGSAGSASSSTTAAYFPTLYIGGDQPNPQTYFSSTIGCRVAMTRYADIGMGTAWHDTLWINGYSGGDVPYMCALHFKRNSEPRFAISSQVDYGTGYGTMYEVITKYNIGSQSVNYASSAGSVAWSNVSGRPTDLSSFSNGPGYVTSSGKVAKAEHTTFTRMYTKWGAGTVTTDISVNTENGLTRCILAICSCHGDSGDNNGCFVYMIRTGYSGNYVTYNTISSSSKSPAYGCSFSQSNGYLTIYNNLGNASILLICNNF